MYFEGYLQGCGAGPNAQAILDGWSRSQKFLGGAGAGNSGSRSTDIICGQASCTNSTMFFLFFGSNCSGPGAKNLKMLGPEPKELDARSWSLKFEYRLHSPGCMCPRLGACAPGWVHVPQVGCMCPRLGTCAPGWEPLL